MKNIYDKWIEIKNKLAELKREELELRNEIIDAFTDKNTYSEGTLKFNEGEYNLTIGIGINRRIDESVLDNIYDDLTEEEKAVIKFKPSLVMKEYKNLSGDEKLFEAIIERPSQPTLKIEKDE